MDQHHFFFIWMIMTLQITCFLLLFAAQMINLYSPLWDLPSLSNSPLETDPSGIYPIQYYVISLTQYNPVGTMYKDGKQQF